MNMEIIKMRKQNMTLLIIIVISMFLFGCGGKDVSSDEGAVNTQEGEATNESEPAEVLFTGTADELLQSIISESDAKLPKVYIDAITAENAPAALGLLADDFASFISEGAAATVESDAVAFQAAVVLCRYDEDAVMIDELIREGFDPGKWVYVFPDRSLTAVSGPYILLAAGSEAETQALADAFKNSLGNSTIINIFYEGETGG